jgi:hypothetical protein
MYLLRKSHGNWETIIMKASLFRRLQLLFKIIKMLITSVVESRFRGTLFLESYLRCGVIG